MLSDIRRQSYVYWHELFHPPLEATDVGVRNVRNLKKIYLKYIICLAAQAWDSSRTNSGAVLEKVTLREEK
jgi:hypothetical protein